MHQRYSWTLAERVGRPRSQANLENCMTLAYAVACCQTSNGKTSNRLPSGLASPAFSLTYSTPAVGGPANGMTSTDLGVVEGAATPVGFSLRLTGTGNVYSDFAWNSPAAQTFGVINTGQNFTAGNDVPPTVTQTSPLDGAMGVGVDTVIAITFSEAVTVTSEAFAVDCAGLVDFDWSGGPLTYTLTALAPFPPSTICTVTVFATEVVDQDGAPNGMAADVTFSFTTETPFVCGATATLIHAIQGAGMASPLVNQVVEIEGVVVGAYQGATGLRGFFVQEEDNEADGDATTSEGMFVFDTLII